MRMRRQINSRFMELPPFQHRLPKTMELHCTPETEWELDGGMPARTYYVQRAKDDSFLVGEYRSLKQSLLILTPQFPFGDIRFLYRQFLARWISCLFSGGGGYRSGTAVFKDDNRLNRCNRPLNLAIKFVHGFFLR